MVWLKRFNSILAELYFTSCKYLYLVCDAHLQGSENSDIYDKNIMFILLVV